MSGAGSAASTEARASAPTAVRTVLLNAASLLGAYAFPRLFTFGAVVVAARVLGPGVFGAYGTAAAYAVILSILATLGMMPLLVRELARAPERAPELLRAAHVVKAGSNVVMIAALLLIARFALDYPGEIVLAALLLGGGYAVGAFAENVGAYFQAIERMHVWMQSSAIFGVVTGVLGAVLVWTTESVVWFCVAPAAGHLAALAWLLHRAPRALRRPGAVPGREVRRLAGSLVPFAGAFVALTLFYKVDVLLLARWRVPEDVGIYVAAYKFMDVVHALAIAAVAAVYPRLARQAPEPGRRERWAATRVSELMLLVAVPGGALLWLLRSEATHVLYGAGYEAGTSVLGLLAPAIPALAMNILAGYVLAAAGRMGLVAKAYAAGILVKVGLNAVLVPLHGAEGAAVAMLVSELMLAGVFLAALRVTAGAAPDPRTLAVAGGAAGACAALALAAPVVPTGTAAAAPYLGVVALLYWRGRVLPAREWRILREALRR